MKKPRETPRQVALKLDPSCFCKTEREPGKVPFAIVRDGAGRIIGRHRTTKVAWEAALRTLSRRNEK